MDQLQPPLVLCVLAEGALLLGEDPGRDVVLAGDGVELDPVDGSGLERAHAPAPAALRGHARVPAAHARAGSSAAPVVGVVAASARVLVGALWREGGGST